MSSKGAEQEEQTDELEPHFISFCDEVKRTRVDEGANELVKLELCRWNTAWLYQSIKHMELDNSFGLMPQWKPKKTWEELNEDEGPAKSRKLLQKYSGKESPKIMEGIIWPRLLESLTFGDKFNQPIDRICLPDNLKCLTFGDEFNQSINGVELPIGLRELTFGRDFNKSTKNVKWSLLEKLTFGDKFNQPIIGQSFPDNLKCLTFGDEFNQSIDGIVLPSGLKELTFGRDFDYSIEKVNWPWNLKRLTFGMNFNQSIRDVLWPQNLRILTFWPSFVPTGKLQFSRIPKGCKIGGCGVLRWNDSTNEWC